MTTQIYIGSIIRTKLHRPPVPRDHVHRQRLLAYPDQRRDRPLTLVNTQTLPLLPVLAASLANEMDAIAQDFIVVLDDIHRVQEKTVYDLFTELLRHPPRPMHLVLIGRRDVSLPTASLRARGLVTEIRLNDLHHHLFQDLIQSQLKQRSSSEEIAALHLRASEWVAKNGLIDEALQHAISANSIPYAVKLIEQRSMCFQGRVIGPIK